MVLFCLSFGMIVQYRMLQILEVVTYRKQESSLHLECSLRSFPAEARLPAEDRVILEGRGRNSRKIFFADWKHTHPMSFSFTNQCLSTDMFFKIFVSAKLFFSSPSPPDPSYIAFIFIVLPVVLKEAKITKMVVSKYHNLFLFLQKKTLKFSINIFNFITNVGRDIS